jgi:hypothetical protein
MLTGFVKIHAGAGELQDSMHACKLPRMGRCLTYRSVTSDLLSELDSIHASRGYVQCTAARS